MSYDPHDDYAACDEPEPEGLASASSSWREGSVRSPLVARRPGMRSRRAFRRFYREHFGLVWSMVRRFGVPPGQHEDAVQEVWIAAHRRLHTLEPDASAKAWLSSIARHVASRLRRTAHRQRRKLAALQEVAGSCPPAASLGAIEGQDARRLLDDLLVTLDDEQRDVLLLAQVHGLTGPEIAQALEIPLNTAYSRLRLARRRVDRFAAELGTERAAVIGALRRGEQPPSRAAAAAWVLLAPELGLGTIGGTIGGGLGTLGGLLSSAKAFVLVAGVGVLGLGAARGIVDARAATPEAAVVSEVAPGSPERVTGSPSAASSMVNVAVGDDATSTHGVVSEASRSVVERPVSRPRSSTSAALDHKAPRVEPDDASPPSSAGAVAGLGAEADLLVRAQQALRAKDAAQALRLLEEHERRFPTGELTDARRGARVRALCELDRPAQARAEARRLLHDRPGSPVAAGVADVCS